MFKTCSHSQPALCVLASANAASYAATLRSLVYGSNSKQEYPQCGDFFCVTLIRKTRVPATLQLLLCGSDSKQNTRQVAGEYAALAGARTHKAKLGARNLELCSRYLSRERSLTGTTQTVRKTPFMVRRVASARANSRLIRAFEARASRMFCLLLRQE